LYFLGKKSVLLLISREQKQKQVETKLADIAKTLDEVIREIESSTQRRSNNPLLRRSCITPPPQSSRAGQRARGR
jgi:hypothetical protein